MATKKKKEPKLVARCRVARLDTHSLFGETYVTPKGRVFRRMKREPNI